MSLWRDYINKNFDPDVLVEAIPTSMSPSLSQWLSEACSSINDPYDLALDIKNRFRIQQPIPGRRPNSYADMTDGERLFTFLGNLASQDPDMFFVVLDFIISTQHYYFTKPQQLESILSTASHKFRVQEISDDTFEIVERIPAEQRALLESAMASNKVYASEFTDAFRKLYGTKPDYTQAAGEAFQALESALKYYMPNVGGRNLGDYCRWLKQNHTQWTYTQPTKGQLNAATQFDSLVNFVNDSYKAVKHGHAEEKMKIDKEHSEAILRAVALLLFELESGLIKLVGSPGA